MWDSRADPGLDGAGGKGVDFGEGGGAPSPTRRGPIIFFVFLSQNGAFLCILLMTRGAAPWISPWWDLKYLFETCTE